MIQKLYRFFAALLTVAVLGGCAGIEVEQYRTEKPQLDLRKFFSGTVEGWGMFQDRSGKVIKRFHVVIEAKWQGDTGGGRFIGTAGDVVGEALGETAGNALRWRYVLALDVDGKTIHVDFDDWMFLVDDRVMLNRSLMSKYGFRLGEVTLSLQRRTP